MLEFNNLFYLLYFYFIIYLLYSKIKQKSCDCSTYTEPYKSKKITQYHKTP